MIGYYFTKLIFQILQTAIAFVLFALIDLKLTALLILFFLGNIVADYLYMREHNRILLQEIEESMAHHKAGHS